MLWKYFLSSLIFLTLAGSSIALLLENIDQRRRSAKTFQDYQEIERLIQKSLERAPRSAALNWRLARNYFALGERASGAREKRKYFKLCMKKADRALALNRKAAEGYYFKGVCAGKAGQLSGVWSSLGIIKPFKKNMERAAALNPAIENGGPHRALGKFYFDLPSLLGGDRKKSIDHLKQAVRYGPGFADNYFYLAESYYADGNKPAARSALLSFLKIARNSPNKPGLSKKLHKAQKLLKKIGK
ncbi:MAG: TRAP transporter TatT component family protein [Nitrospinales bacterium]